MFSRIFAVSCCFVLTGASGQPGQDGAIAPQRAPKVEAVHQSCAGKVLEVTKNSITIQPELGGQPRRFTACALLASGDCRRVGVPCDMYKLSDVQLGDKVDLEYSLIDGVAICDAIAILRRPGGRVPPGHYPPNLVDPPHERAQAYQDLEEKGIPLPAKYDPTFHLRETQEIMLRLQGRVAPMPREVKPRIPPAKD